MGAASLIATAVGLFLILFAGYVLVGGALSMSKMVAAAQKDASERQVEQVHTVIEITDGYTTTTGVDRAVVTVTNTGSEPVPDVSDIDVYMVQDSLMQYLPYESGAWTFTLSPDTIHPNAWNPDEVMTITIPFSGGGSHRPTWASVVTPNGISDSTYLDAR